MNAGHSNGAVVRPLHCKPPGCGFESSAFISTVQLLEHFGAKIWLMCLNPTPSCVCWMFLEANKITDQSTSY